MLFTILRAGRGPNTYQHLRLMKFIVNVLLAVIVSLKLSDGVVKTARSRRVASTLDLPSFQSFFIAFRFRSRCSFTFRLSANSRRLGSALRFIRLIRAGDVELNPGPINFEFMCRTCSEECEDGEGSVLCDSCSSWTHFKCSTVTNSVLNQLHKYKNLGYFCDQCLSQNKQDKLRNMSKTLASRGLILGNLLDLYDRQEAVCSTETETQTSGQLDESVSVIQDQEPVEEVSASSEQEGPPVIVKGSFDPLSNFFKFRFVFKGKVYYSVEHAYQTLKANLAGCHSLAKQIRFAPSPQIAKRLARSLPSLSASECCRIMGELLDEKTKQCRAYRDKLRDSGSRAILHSTYRNADMFWTTGLDYRDVDAHKKDFPGLNILGHLLRDQRVKLQDEEFYTKELSIEEYDRYVIYSYDDPPRGFWNGGRGFPRRGV